MALCVGLLQVFAIVMICTGDWEGVLVFSSFVAARLVGKACCLGSMGSRPNQTIIRRYFDMRHMTSVT